jgi:hypothetical protein
MPALDPLAFGLDPTKVSSVGRVSVLLTVSNRTDRSVSNLCLQLSGNNGLRILGKDVLKGIGLGPRSSTSVPLDLRVEPGSRQLRLHTISLRIEGHSQTLPDVSLSLEAAPPLPVSALSQSISLERGTAVSPARPSYLEPPFEAYVGRQPYAFVSYSLHDGAAVFSEISRLRRGGLRIWYDEGIHPGKEWSQALASALREAAMFLVFISPNSVRRRTFLTKSIMPLTTKSCSLQSTWNEPCFRRNLN